MPLLVAYISVVLLETLRKGSMFDVHLCLQECVGACVCMYVGTERVQLLWMYELLFVSVNTEITTIHNQ